MYLLSHSYVPALLIVFRSEITIVQSLMLIVYVQGKFTGEEVEMRVVGTVDGEPVRATVHYVPSKQVRVHASYRSEDYFSLSFTTQLQDFHIGTMGVSGWTSFVPLLILHTVSFLLATFVELY